VWSGRGVLTRSPWGSAWSERDEPEPEGLRARIDPSRLGGELCSWLAGPNGSEPARGLGAYTDGVSVHGKNLRRHLWFSGVVTLGHEVHRRLRAASVPEVVGWAAKTCVFWAEETWHGERLTIPLESGPIGFRGGYMIGNERESPCVMDHWF
jgi:hypothetical protein